MNIPTTLRGLLLGAALAAAALAAQAQAGGQKEVLTDPQARLNFVRGLPYSGERPTLGGFSPAQPLKGVVAPAGQHEQTQAYRSANGCAAFFFPLGPEVAEVAFKWSGPACKSPLLEGRGELQIRRRMGENTAVAVLRGEFKGGMLTGEAQKTYFYFDGKGQALPGVHLMMGSFANSVLHGKGTARWSGAPDARPSAWFREGVFKDGSLRGEGVLARLRPYPGVEAEIQNLVFAEDGEIYIEQARMNGGRLIEGTLYFDKDPQPWKVELAVWRNASVEAARLLRTDPANETVLLAACEQWRFEGARLSCDRGSVSHGIFLSAVGASNGAFTVNLPVRGNELPFRPGANTPLTMGMGTSEFPARCDADMKLCNGRGVLPIGLTTLYWHGDIEWREGVMRPVQASLYVLRDKDANPKPDSDRRVARCERFDDPLRCREGKVFWEQGGSFEGAWTYEGTSFEAEGKIPPRYVGHGEQNVRPRGWGRLNYAGGEWAEVRLDADGDVVDVRQCDKPRESANFTCHVDGGTVFFQAQGRERQAREREAPARSVYVAPSGGSGRFEPVQVPQRPVYVLPGMR